MLIEMTLVPAMLERDRMCEVQNPVDVEAGQFETSVRSTAQSRPSASRPDRGRTTILYEVFNQKDEIVMSYSAIHILRRRA